MPYPIRSLALLTVPCLCLLGSPACRKAPPPPAPPPAPTAAPGSGSVLEQGRAGESAPATAAPPTSGDRAAAPAPEGKDEFPANYYLAYYQGPDEHRTIRAAHRPLEGKPAPPIQIKTWIGDPVDFDGLDGKVVVVDFWATWCPPCMRAIPHNIELVNKYAADGLVLVGVHDSSGGWERAPQTVSSRQIVYAVGLDDGGKSTAAWQVQFWPTYGVIDRKGILRALGVSPDALEPIVTKLLAEPA